MLEKPSEEHTVFSDDYFVHFFPTETLTNFPKHIVFVVDVSGSMSGTKLEQTKDAMITLVDTLKDTDHFNIITFDTDVYLWPNSRRSTYGGTAEKKKEAITYIRNLRDLGRTNINDALLAGIEVINNLKGKILRNTKPMIFFMTDGFTNEGETNPERIKRNVANQNSLCIPIHGLAFGNGADFNLIESISDPSGGKSTKYNFFFIILS